MADYRGRAVHSPWPWIAGLLGLILVILVAWLVASRTAEERIAQRPAPVVVSTQPQTQPQTPSQPQQPTTTQPSPPAVTTPPPAPGSQQANERIQAAERRAQQQVRAARRQQRIAQEQMREARRETEEARRQAQAPQQPAATPAPSGGGRGAGQPEVATNVSGNHPGTHLPHNFRYQGSNWVAEESPSRPPSGMALVSTQDLVNGQQVFVQKGEQKPYDTIYLRMNDNSGRYLEYDRQPSMG